ncbi:MAG TPA: hypothetical protein VIY48_17285, partial [Candidatus Paceibacterota bacterium]
PMAEQNEENKNNIDLNKILLPNKEVHTSASAERVNAGVLLAQEQQAAAEGLKGDRTGTDNGLGAPPERGSEDLGGSSSVPPPPPPKPKKEESVVQSIQTYKSDVESLVQEKNVSVVSIAAAEAKKREEAPIATPEPEAEHWILKRVSLVIGGVLLMAIAGGALAYVLTRPTTVPVTPLSTSAPFINVDDTKQVSIDPTASTANIMQTLNGARTSVSLSLGLVERLYITAGSGSNAKEVPIKTLLGALAPQAPQALLRTLNSQYLLGVHSFDENQAFLLLQTDSYETAYAAMLQWEPTMSHDLLPLFSRTPPVHAQQMQSSFLATSTATSSTQNASTTPKDYFAASTTTLPTPTIAQSGLPTTFTDRVVENHDARVLQTKDGDILLMWTFLDRKTLVITTNEFTLREIINRITQAPTINLPQ